MRLLLDTMNVLHAWDSGMVGDALTEIPALAREIGQSRYKGYQTTLVCDGAPIGDLEGRSWSSCAVRFAGSGRDADTLIEYLIDRDTAPRRLVVVSSDRRIMKAARRRRAKPLPSEDFLVQIAKDAGKPAPTSIRPAFARQVPLEQRAIEFWHAVLGEPTGAVKIGDEERRRLSRLLAQAGRSGLEDPSGQPPTPEARKQGKSKKTSSGRPKPAKPGPTGHHTDLPTPAEAREALRAAAETDPVLAEALRAWSDRLSLEDLDMSRWLGPPD